MTVQSSGEFGHVRDPVGEPLPAFAVLLEGALGAEQVGTGLAHGGDDFSETLREGLSGKFVEQGLRIAEIEVGGARLP